MPDILTVYAETQPDKVAVVDDKGGDDIVQLTYAELEAASNRLANALLALGARPGSKVIWCGPNSVPVVVVVNAARKIGTVAVPLNYRLTPEEARYVINHSDAEIAYVDTEYAHLFDGLVGELATLRHVIVYGGPARTGMLSSEELAASASDQPADVGDAVGTGGTMIYTSGTTGKPKGAVRYATDMETGLALVRLPAHDADDIYLRGTPLDHCGRRAFIRIGVLFRRRVGGRGRFVP